MLGSADTALSPRCADEDTWAQQSTGPVRRGRKEGHSQTRWGWKHWGCSLSQVSDFRDTQDVSRTNLVSDPGSEDLPVNDHTTELGER